MLFTHLLTEPPLHLILPYFSVRDLLAIEINDMEGDHG